MPLTPRQRVLMALNHEEPDRVPIIIGTSNTTTLKIRPYQRLKALLGVRTPDRYIYDWPELGSAAIDESAASTLLEVVRDTVVVRGDEAMAPRELLSLKLPEQSGPAGADLADLANEGAGSDADTDGSAEGDSAPNTPSLDDLKPFERGPEITEIH